MKRLPIIPIVFLLVVAGMALKIAVPTWLVSLKTPVDFNMLAEEDIRSGVRVKGDVYAILDSFAVEESWTENSNGSVTPKETSNYYYIIPIGEESYAALEIRAGDHAAYDAVADATWSYLIGETDTLGAETAPFDGYITTMEDDLYDLFVEWFQDTEYFGTTDATMIQAYAMPYMLTTYSTSGTYSVLGIGLAALLIAVLLLVLYLRGRKKRRQAAAEVSAAAPATATAEERPLSPTSPESVARDLEQ